MGFFKLKVSSANFKSWMKFFNFSKLQYLNFTWSKVWENSTKFSLINLELHLKFVHRCFSHLWFFLNHSSVCWWIFTILCSLINWEWNMSNKTNMNERIGFFEFIFIFWNPFRSFFNKKKYILLLIIFRRIRFLIFVSLFDGWFFGFLCFLDRKFSAFN